MTRAREGQSGFALVLVLWAAMIMALIAASLMSQSCIAARIERNEWRRLETETFARNAVNQVTLDLLSRADLSPALLAGTRLSGTIDGVAFDYWVEDETGKVDLNEVDVNLLEAAFAAAGVSTSKARALAKEIIEWRSAPAENPALARDAPPRFRRFQSVNELLFVDGVDEETLTRAHPFLTVHAQASAVNLEAASVKLLEALPYVEKGTITQILERRLRATEVLGEPATAPSVSVYAPLAGTAISVTVSFSSSGKRFEFQKLARFTGRAEDPIMTLSWVRL